MDVDLSSDANERIAYRNGLRRLRTLVRRGDATCVREVPGATRLELLAQEWDVAEQKVARLSDDLLLDRDHAADRAETAAVLSRDVTRASAVVLAVGVAIFLVGERIAPGFALLVGFMPGIMAIAATVALFMHRAQLRIEARATSVLQDAHRARGAWFRAAIRHLSVLERRILFPSDLYADATRAGSHRVLSLGEVEAVLLQSEVGPASRIREVFAEFVANEKPVDDSSVRSLQQSPKMLPQGSGLIAIAVAGFAAGVWSAVEGNALWAFVAGLGSSLALGVVLLLLGREVRRERLALGRVARRVSGSDLQRRRDREVREDLAPLLESIAAKWKLDLVAGVSVVAQVLDGLNTSIGGRTTEDSTEDSIESDVVVLEEVEKVELNAREADVRDVEESSSST